jgi:hypothetical protein
MPEEKYLSIGEYLTTNQVIGGELRVYPTELEDRFRVEGTITRDNAQQEVKGIASHESIGDKIVPSILLFEFPIKEGANNIIYKLDGKFKIEYKKLNPEKYGKTKTLKESMLEGKYSCDIFPDAIIIPLDEEILKEYESLGIKEFVFPEIDFDSDKGIPVAFTLEKTN